MKSLLTEEVMLEAKELPKMDIGSPIYTATIHGIDTLTKDVVELEKVEIEKLEKERLIAQEKLKADQLELERIERLNLQTKQLELQVKQLEIQEKQHKETKRNNTLQIVVLIGTAILGAALKVWGTNTCLEYEKDSNITTTPGKFHVGSLFGRK